MGVIPMGEHYKSIFLSVIILADKFPFVEQFNMYQPYSEKSEYGFFFYTITPIRPTACAEHHAGGLFLYPSLESYPHFSSPYQAP